jgi:predicted outer membrane repeat protein
MNLTQSFHFRSAGILFLGMLLATPAMAQTNRHVDADTGNDSGNNCTNSASPCATIAHALGQSTAGDRILAAAGIYTESLDIDRDIEILGEASETTVIQAAAEPNTASQRVITVQSGRKLELRHLTIRHGYASATGSPGSLGGGIYLDAGELELEHVVLTANRSASHGGAIYNAAGSLHMRHADLTGNWSQRLDGSRGRGGAVYNADGATLTALNSFFRGNEAGQGGAIYSFGSDITLTLTNVALTGNFSTNFGGAIMDVSGAPVMTNVVFSANRTEGLGGGLYTQSSSSPPSIRNSVFWNNQDDTGVGTRSASLALGVTKPAISHSLVQGCGASGGSWNNECGTDSGGNRPSQNPNFIAAVSPAGAPTSQGYFRQNTGSPLIGRGNNSYIAGVTTDLDGWARIIDGVVDLGPYEFGNDVLLRDRFEP